MHHRDSHRGMNRLASAVQCVLQPLEKRQLLAGNVFDINKVPIFTPTSGDLGDLKNGPLANAGHALSDLYIDYKKFIRNGGNASEFSVSDDRKLVSKGNQVGVTLRARASIDEVSQLVRSIGGELIFRSKAYRVVETYLPVSQLSTVAAHPGIASLNPLRAMVSYGQGQVFSQAEQALNADSLRATFGLTGAGVKIGVISDSVNAVNGGLADSYESGDLPSPSDIDVIEDGAGADEGRAMLELIHDIAPKASLAFAPPGGSLLAYAENVRRLFDAGCDVIVDDIGILTEPLFQESVLSQAITNVTAEGAVYVAAAGNQQASGFQDTARWVRGSDGRWYMDFDPDPDRVDTTLGIDLTAGESIPFFWDDPYNGIVGAPTADLDVTLIDPLTGAIYSEGGNDNNFATGNPMEFITPLFTDRFDMVISIAEVVDPAKLPTKIGFVRFGSDPSFQGLEHAGETRTATLGHSSGIDTLSVGAVPFYETPAYDTDGIISNEYFTSYGPRTLLFKMNGERRAKAQKYFKPDLSGVDNTNTTFFGADVNQDPDKYPNFSGTSAAAPNVAAVAVLLIELAKNQEIAYTPDTIKNALIQSAKTQPVNGNDPGEWDARGGFGLVDGVEAARILVPDLPSADVQRVVPFDQPRGVDSLTINFNEPVSGFDLSDITLTRSGGANLINGDVSLNTDDNQTFVLSGLRAITKRRGTYKIVINGAGIQDADANPAFGTREIFYVSGKPTNVTVTAIDHQELNVHWYDNAVGEAGYRVYRSQDPSFNSGVKTYVVGPNATKFRDIGLSPTTRYYYKVKPIYQDITIETPPSAVVYGTTLARNEIVVDNLSSKGVSVVGEWSSVSSGNRWGVNYLTDQNSGKGDKSVTFAPGIKEAGDYFVYVRWVPGDDRASNVPVNVLSAAGKTTVTVNQRTNSNWKLLGKFRFNKGSGGYVRILNEGTNGLVVADAARFVKASNSGGGIDSGTSFETSPFSTTNVAVSNQRSSILDEL